MISRDYTLEVTTHYAVDPELVVRILNSYMQTLFDTPGDKSWAGKIAGVRVRPLAHMEGRPND